MYFRSILAILSIPLAFPTAASLAQGTPAAADSQRTVVIRMKSDLRNLVVAQEAYYAGHTAYADSVSALRFRANAGSDVHITVNRRNGWGGVVTSSALPGVRCVIWVNLPIDERPRVQEVTGGEGEPICGPENGPSMVNGTPARSPTEARLKSDLRNLVVAQERYFAEHRQYATSMNDLAFNASEGTQVRLVTAASNGWSGEATDAHTAGKSCVIFVNVTGAKQPHTAMGKHTDAEGMPVCDDFPN